MLYYNAHVNPALCAAVRLLKMRTMRSPVVFPGALAPMTIQTSPRLVAGRGKLAFLRTLLISR